MVSRVVSARAKAEIPRRRAHDVPVGDGCAVCGDGVRPPADFYGPWDLTESVPEGVAEAADSLRERRDGVRDRLATAAALGARIPAARWRHRSGYAAHIAAYTRTITGLEVRRWRLLGWTWPQVGAEVAADRARELFGGPPGRAPGSRDRCRTCGSRVRPGPVTHHVPHAVLAPALRRHASAEPPDWAPPDDQPQAGLITVLGRTRRVGATGGLRALLDATTTVLTAAVARDVWDGDDDGTVSAALGAPVRTSAGGIEVPGVLDL